jgi:amidase
MGRFAEYDKYDAIGLADLVRKKQVQPSELVDEAITRIEKMNPTLNAVITPLFDEARTAAKGVLPEGPFKGVPFLLKDAFALYKGVRMTSGSASRRDFIPDHDSELVVRLKNTGLIFLGKTNTPEFGLLPTTEPRLFGPTRNPWDITHTPGGSSGGSAAAVASRMVPMAHGNDGGGSLRIPAACCGVFALKPTRARNPLGPDFGDCLSGIVVEHALTRSVRDSAALLDSTMGPDVGDPYWAPPPERPFLNEVNAAPGSLNIAFTTAAPAGIPANPDCVSAVRSAASLCNDLGHHMTEVGYEVPWHLLAQCFMTLWAAGCTAQIDGFAAGAGRKPVSSDFEPLTWALYEMGQRKTAADYISAVAILQAISRGIAGFFQKYDVLITPTLAEPPVPLGTFDPSSDDLARALEQVTQRALQFSPYTFVCNVTGQPAMSVPLYWNSGGLPIGVHFIAPFGDEATLFRLAGQLEKARPWADRLPPICSPRHAP